MKPESDSNNTAGAVAQERIVRHLEVGADVWIYDGQAPPRPGTITASGERIVTGTWYARDTFGERLYSRHVLFTDPENLIAEVQDTVALLERWEREFQPNVKAQATETAI